MPISYVLHGSPEFTLVRSVHGGVCWAGELLLEVLGVAERADDPEPARRVHVGQHLAQQRLGGLDLAPHLQQHLICAMTLFERVV